MYILCHLDGAELIGKFNTCGHIYDHVSFFFELLIMISKHGNVNSKKRPFISSQMRQSERKMK